ncbi:TetR/AcrR family transcriptional regulator [Tabrizicola soli]|uniref:TetR/AcrR family transcriptional regulator n=1 Tax=Tabrizicola soli TaxID=2185115 RepID=A0ABV7DTN1_9RHOB|nr:TetR family transcriptional regulator [Tabrizicola soli]
MTSRAKHLPSDERRAEAVEAVVELAARSNPEEITTSAIAARMKLTQGALFRHYPTKDAIWQGVMEWVSDRLLARIDRLAGAEADPLAALQAMFLGHVDFIAEHPGVPRMMAGQLQNAGETPAKRMARTLVENYGNRLRRILAAARAEGVLHPTLDIEAAAALFLGMIQGLVMQHLIHGDSARMRADAARVWTIYRAGLLAGPQAREPSPVP